MHLNLACNSLKDGSNLMNLITSRGIIRFSFKSMNNVPSSDAAPNRGWLLAFHWNWMNLSATSFRCEYLRWFKCVLMLPRNAVLRMAVVDETNLENMIRLKKYRANRSSPWRRRHDDVPIADCFSLQAVINRKSPKTTTKYSKFNRKQKFSFVDLPPDSLSHNQN